MTVGPLALPAAEIPAAQAVPVRESWVQCDSCTKWRRVPKALADALDEDAPW